MLAGIAGKYKNAVLRDRQPKLAEFMKSVFAASRGTFQFFACRHRGAELRAWLRSSAQLKK